MLMQVGLAKSDTGKPMMDYKTSSEVLTGERLLAFATLLLLLLLLPLLIPNSTTCVEVAALKHGHGPMVCGCRQTA
jgi:hypothetical protein